MHSKKPTSSLSRRLFVGLKIRDRKVIGPNLAPVAGFEGSPSAKAHQSLSIMSGTESADNRGLRNPYRVDSWAKGKQNKSSQDPLIQSVGSKTKISCPTSPQTPARRSPAQSDRRQRA